MALQGYFCVFMAALLWGLLGPLAKFGFAVGAQPLETAFWRALLGALFFLIHCLAFRLYKIRLKDFPMLFLFGLAGVSVFFGSYQIAVRESGAALASMLLYTAPAWVALLSRLFFKEPMTPLKLLALMVAMGGAALVSAGSAGSAGGEGLFALKEMSLLARGMRPALRPDLRAALHLRETLSAGLPCRHPVPIHPAGGCQWVCCPLWTSPSGHLLPRAKGAPPSQRGLYFWFWGLFTTYGAYMFYCAGLKRLDATRVAVTANLEPVMAALLAFLWWDEFFRPIGYVGGALVLTGVLLMVYDGTRADRMARAKSAQASGSSISS